MNISIPSPSECHFSTCAPPIGEPSTLTWADAFHSEIKRVVNRWEETKALIPSPIMDLYYRVARIVRLTGEWPLDIVAKAEEFNVELPPANQEDVIKVVGSIYAQRVARADPSCNNANNFTPSEWQEKIRKIIGVAEIVSPDVIRELGSYMIRHPSMAWWVHGEERNQYVPAGEGILFRRDENVYHVPLKPLPKMPAESKEWTWGQKAAWRTAELEKIPKKTVTVICEYGSRRYAEGEPVLNIEGQVERYRWAGEWGREMVAFLKGMPSPSPYFYDDYTGHPAPHQSAKIKAFRQEVADACFVLMHQK
jgi:hypothetical protein